MTGSPFEGLDDAGSPKRSRRGSSVVPLLVFGGLTVLFLGTVVCGGLFLWVKTLPPPTPRPERQVYDRDGFRALVLGSTPDEVIRAVGKPDHTTETSSQEESRDRGGFESPSSAYRRIAEASVRATSGAGGVSTTQTWHYYGRTRDPITGKIDEFTRVRFKNGRASHVDY